MKAFYQNTIELLESIDDLLQKRRVLPCLTLLYTGIDIIAALERDPNEGTKAAFLRWAGQYMNPEASLRCSALELYADRCGILHTFTSDSDLSRQGKVRKILYAWGTAQPEPLDRAVALLGSADAVGVKIESLITTFRNGLADYLQDVQADQTRYARFERQAGAWLVHMEPTILRRFVESEQTAT